MKNKANPRFTKCPKHQTNTKTVWFFTTIFPKKIPNFPKKSKKIKKNNFCKFQTQTHLSPYIPRLYKAFYPLFFAFSLFLFASFSITFMRFSALFNVFKLLDQKVLNYIYNKDLQEFFQELPFTIQERNLPA